MTFSGSAGEVRIRAMGAGDIDAVMAIAAGLETAPQWPRGAYESAIDAASAPRVGLVAELEGEVVGFAIASLIPPEAELETIGVSRSQQRRGTGSALCTAILRELEMRGIREITLEVRASNLAARAFYERHSFAAFAERRGYYPDSGEPAILMRASIAVGREME